MNDAMTDSRAVEVLSAHNEWRRYDGETGAPGAPVMGDVKELGHAIDHAVSRLRSQPPAEAQAQGGGEVRAWMRRWAFDKVDVMALPKKERPPGWHLLDITEAKCLGDDVPLYTAPPSAPVGVGVDVVREYLDARACYEEATRRPNSHAPIPVLKHGDPVVLRLRDARAALDHAIALAQQPVSDGGFTAADMMVARQEGRKEAQQSAAVDGAALTDAAIVAGWEAKAKVHEADDTFEGALKAWQLRDCANELRSRAALAAKTGGSDNDNQQGGA